MPRRRIGQLSWVDGALAGRGRRRDVLGEIDRLVDWQPFERLLSGIHGAAKGEAAYPPLMMFKVVLLQRWYGLSDPQMEEALFERLQLLTKGRLSVVVSHRMASVRGVDRILVLERGVLTEDGHHTQLMRDGKLYAKLFAMHAAKYI